MKISVDKKLIDIYHKYEKSVGYMLDFLLSSLDVKCCKETIILFEMNNNGEKTEIEIDDKTISEINTLFESADDKLIEKLLYFAVIFPEI